MVTVIGLGFVGLTTALAMAEYGYRVYGIDTNMDRLNTISSGKIPFYEPGLDTVLKKHLNNNFIPTADLGQAVRDSGFIFFCVGTPCGEDGQADLTALFGAIDNVLSEIDSEKNTGNSLHRIFIMKSTIPPATVTSRVIPYITVSGYRIPEDLGIANNPEFLREGHCWEDFINADRIVVGTDDARTGEMIKKLYEPSERPVYIVSHNTAEFIKYLSNTALATLISFANDMSRAAAAIGNIDVKSAFEILHLDKRWQDGSIRNYCYPGIGFGGYCLPKDTMALEALAQSYGYESALLRKVTEINEGMAEFTADRIIRAAGCDTGRTIGILGLSFNPGSDDVRCAPVLKVIDRLYENGFDKLVAYDPIASENFERVCKVPVRYAGSMNEVIEEADILAVTVRPRLTQFTVNIRFSCRVECCKEQL